MLPAPLSAAPFSVQRAYEEGVSRRRLRAGDLDKTFWGIRSATTPVDVAEYCRILQVRMPQTSAFSHTTAALLIGIPVPWWRERESRLHVTMPAPHRAPHASGLTGHRLTLATDDLTTIDGLRITTPARTWGDLGELIPLLDLVAAGDFLLHGASPLTTREELTDAVARRVSRRGMRNVRAALPLLNGRSESPPESILRALLVLDGFPEPRVNHSVTDSSGEFVARTDLILDEYRLVLEYQGDYHRTTKGQWRADMTRRSKVESQDWRVMELNADDLRDPVELLARIRRRARLPR